ncbi:hypothetical protein [Capnocytophaga canis]|uniref:hypothetical protein n=1 Tax=Capnocytophaga canis TaxID=1848903 RepID=UPI001562BD4B|nr:hypothetical protein [Capnocytophaga canis]
MTNKLTKQVEVQGMKKLDSIKGVQALDAKELREIDGGSVWKWIRKHVGVWFRAKREPITGEFQYYEGGIGLNIPI